MKKRRILALAGLVLVLASESTLALLPPPEATVTARKGPIQITLRLYKTTVGRDRSLWYQIEMKNVGKKRIPIGDKIFRDPWAMHENIFHRYGIYLDITAPPGRYEDTTWPPHKLDGKSPQLRPGAGRVHYDFGDRDLNDQELADAKKELALQEAKWSKQGLTELEKKKARVYWNSEWNRRKESEEDAAKISWLEPGASTTTFAWAYHDADPHAVHSGPDADVTDEEPQIGDYTQLWSYSLFYPGNYHIRAVYMHGPNTEEKALDRKYGGSVSPWRVTIETPAVEFQVMP